ncbi:centrosomal protein of 162 kDa [Plutella xylostella]|uniref:centrosomal protein of 162 kDa n=1 Tax=Plutella xylostella TaxID=51655 RepID=UPI002032E699|nr:centrosomal protein of 162 kDa [Plutella xylostella]
MAQSLVESIQESTSNDNSISTKEFLRIEKNCEGYKDSDEEIKLIFNEINKLSGANNNNNSILLEDNDDVELILKRAEDIAQETENLFKSSPIAAAASPSHEKQSNVAKIPQIKVTKPDESKKTEKASKDSREKANNKSPKHNNKENNETVRHKAKVRPYSAGVIDSKKRDAAKGARFVTNSPKKSCKHENILEELKDTNERVKGLELLNVQLNEDNRVLRKKLDEVNEKKHVTELKLGECEKFLSRVGKEYENRNRELTEARDNENKLLAELNKERNERKNLKILHDKDATVIQDLQRQCKEMEMILKRKHPDSVSALIVASKSTTVEDNKKKLLEERTTRLEQELKDKEDHFQHILLTLQQKFGDMKLKYENHIIDVERQLMEDRKTNTELKNRLNKCNLVDACVQTTAAQNTAQTQTFIRTDRASSAVSRLSQNSALLLTKLKEDSYLCATIKGLQAELTLKQRALAKINRESDELKKNLRNLQKEKEVLLNINPSIQKKIVYKQNKSAENLLSRVNCELEAELAETRQQKEVLMQERNSLLDSLKRTNEEFILLKKKRIQDLHTLQLAHEKELMQMNMQLYPLQEEVNRLNRTVEALQDRGRSEDKMRCQGSEEVGGGDNNGRGRGRR